MAAKQRAALVAPCPRNQRRTSLNHAEKPMVLLLVSCKGQRACRRPRRRLQQRVQAMALMDALPGRTFSDALHAGGHAPRTNCPARGRSAWQVVRRQRHVDRALGGPGCRMAAPGFGAVSAGSGRGAGQSAGQNGQMGPRSTHWLRGVDAALQAAVPHVATKYLVHFDDSGWFRMVDGDRSWARAPCSKGCSRMVRAPVGAKVTSIR